MIKSNIELRNEKVNEELFREANSNCVSLEMIKRRHASQSINGIYYSPRKNSKVLRHIYVTVVSHKGLEDLSAKLV